MGFCDCWVAILNGYDQSETNNLYLTNYKIRLTDRAFLTKEMAKLSGRGKEFKPKDYIDKRKSLSIMFSYCPKCETKINWRKLQETL